MAYNEVTLPQWQQLIRRVFGLVGPGGNIPSVAPEIQPVAILQPDNPEFRRLRGEKLWACPVGQTAGVGNVASTAIVNPAGSGKIVTVERVHAEMKAGAGITDGIAIRVDTQANVEGHTGGGTIPVVGPRDSREITPGAGASAAVLRFGNTAAPPAGFPIAQYTSLPGAAIITIPLAVTDVVLFPGFGMSVTNFAIGNTESIQVNYFWFERALESAEGNSP